MDFQKSEREELVIDLERGIDGATSEEGSEGSNFSDGQVKLLRKKDFSVFDEKMIGEGMVKLPQNFSSSPCGQFKNGEGSADDRLKTGMDIGYLRKMDSGMPRRKTFLKSPKPPRPPKSLSMDVADQKLIQEIAEFAKLKQARIERRKALKKKKSSKESSGTNLGAMIVTILFCLVIFWEVMSNRYLGFWLKRSR